MFSNHHTFNTHALIYITQEGGESIAFTNTTLQIRTIVSEGVWKKPGVLLVLQVGRGPYSVKHWAKLV